MLLVELTGAINADGILRTWCFSDIGFVTGANDLPAHTVFLPRLKEKAGEISVSAFSEGQTSGSSQLQAGDLVLVNVDGGLDELIAYSFEARPLVIRSGSEGAAYPADCPTIFTGTVASVSATLSAFTIKLKDKALGLDRPVLTERYAGTNIGPAGLEGTSDDLKGELKGRVFGRVREIAPRCVNTSLLTYRVNLGEVAEIAVFDRGLALALGADHASSAALAAATIADGEFDTCLAEGLFRLGASPAGQVTADVAQGASEAARTVASLVNALAQLSGLSDAEISADDVSDLAFQAPYEAGIAIGDETTFRAAMDALVASVGGWWAFDLDGVLRMGLLAEPDALITDDFIEADVLTGFERSTPDGEGIPAWRVNVRYARFYTPQTSDVAGSVDAARRAALAQEWRTVSAEDPAVKFQWLQAQDLTIETCLANEDDAQAVADAILAIRKRRRDLFDMPITLDRYAERRPGMMRSVELDHSRFSLDGGKRFRIIGLAPEFGRKRITLKLWG